MMLKAIVFCSVGVLFMSEITTGEVLSLEPFKKSIENVCKLSVSNIDWSRSEHFKCVLKNLGFIDENDELSDAGIEKFFIDNYGQSATTKEVIKLVQQCTKVTGGCKVEKMKHFIQCIKTADVRSHFQIEQ